MKKIVSILLLIAITLCMLAGCDSDYQEQTSDERYETLIYDFSKASIQYLERNQLAELAKYNVANIFSEIVQDYVDVTVNNFKNREK